MLARPTVHVVVPMKAPSASKSRLVGALSNLARERLVESMLASVLHARDRYLKPGGVMIFDDYLWQHYPNSRHNPASAIHAFLRLKRPEIELLRAYRQLAIRKR